MTDFIRLQHGAPPWQGTGDSVLAETYDYYDIPLVGIIEQHGVRYLFRCLAGQVESMNMWRYTLIEDAAIAELDRIDGPRDFDRAVARMQTRVPGVLAVSIDGYGIVGSSEVEDWSNVQPHVREILNFARDFVHRLQSDVEAQGDRLALASSSFA